MTLVRTFSLIIILAATSLAATAQRLTFAERDAAHVGIYVKDLRTGRVLASENELQAFTPASVMKTVTAASALTALGPDFRFATQFALRPRSGVSDSRPLTAGRLFEGDLIVFPSGDPTIGTRHLKGCAGVADSVAFHLRGLGVATICGSLRLPGPNSGGIGEKWEVEDIDWAYGSGCYLFNFADNATSMLNPLTDRVEDYSNPVPWTTFHNRLSLILRDSGVVVEEIADAAPTEAPSSDASATSLPQPLPSDFLVYTHLSPRAADILKDMLRRSDNLYAEAMLRALSPSRSLDDALSAQTRILDSLGIPTATAKIYDGSGLSRPDLLTPLFLASLLEKMAGSPYAKEYVGSFPLAGRDGTVKNIFRRTRLEGRMALKSGSMGGVHCYAGYALDANRRPTHTVVVMVNNFFCPRSDLRKAIEAYLLRLIINE